MKKSNIFDISRIVKIIVENRTKITLLCVGVVSKNVVRKTLELGNDYRFPVIFISSRSQVDSKANGSGYVEKWDQKGLSDYINLMRKDMRFDGLVYKCRDHGGPFLRNDEVNFSFKDSLARSMKTFEGDAVDKWDLIHVDGTANSGGLKMGYGENIRRSAEMISMIENMKGKKHELGYEVTMDELDGNVTKASDFRSFVEDLMCVFRQKNLNPPLFVSAQTGTLVKMCDNIGEFDEKSTRSLAKIALRNNIGFKEHNVDYSTEKYLKKRPKCGVTASNIAPELGSVETDALLELCDIEKNVVRGGASNFYNILSRKVVSGNLWRKWVIEDVRKSKRTSDSKRKMLLTRICGHYFFSDNDVKISIKKLYDNLKGRINTDDFIGSKIEECLLRYVKSFNLEGSIDKMGDFNGR